MIRIAAVLFAAIVSDVPALADERISRAIEAASEMYVAGLQVQDIEAGGKYRDEIQASMVMAAKRYGGNPSMFCAAAAADVTGSTANVIELRK
jgi:hypothetical protein